MAFKFYLVQKDGVPAVWQSEPERLERLLKHKAGYMVISDTPSDTRRGSHQTAAAFSRVTAGEVGLMF